MGRVEGGEGKMGGMAGRSVRGQQQSVDVFLTQCHAVNRDVFFFSSLVILFLESVFFLLLYCHFFFSAPLPLPHPLPLLSSPLLLPLLSSSLSSPHLLPSP